jgi:pSer/pThr/pTyr-binding forkhead associated (FHA) protein
MADDSGSEVDSLVNQAMFELAVKLNYVEPVAQEMSDPREMDEDMPARKPAQKFTPGRTRDQSRKAPPSPAKRPPRPSPRAAPAKSESKGLHIVNEDGETEKINKDIYIIGRSSKCDLVINSVKVSREHSIITRERGEYFIEDLGSANGTWYKGEKIEKMKIKDGDEIFICDEKFKFVVR